MALGHPFAGHTPIIPKLKVGVPGFAGLVTMVRGGIRNFPRHKTLFHSATHQMCITCAPLDRQKLDEPILHPPYLLVGHPHEFIVSQSSAEWTEVSVLSAVTSLGVLANAAFRDNDPDMSRRNLVDSFRLLVIYIFLLFCPNTRSILRIIKMFYHRLRFGMLY